MSRRMLGHLDYSDKVKEQEAKKKLEEEKKAKEAK